MKKQIVLLLILLFSLDIKSAAQKEGSEFSYPTDKESSEINHNDLVPEYEANQILGYLPAAINDLTKAIVNNDLQSVKNLLADKKVDVNKIAKNTIYGINETPLVFAVLSRNGNLKIIDVLVKAGANLNHQDYYKNTPLIFVTKKYLALKDKDEKTLAKKEKLKEIIDYLLFAGADVILQNVRNESFLTLIKDNNELNKLFKEYLAKRKQDIHEKVFSLPYMPKELVEAIAEYLGTKEIK